MISKLGKYPKFNDPEQYLRSRENRSIFSKIKRVLESQIISNLLGGLPGIRTVCDAPSGPGRLFPLWSRLGYRVLGADISASMAQHASACHEQHGLEGVVVEGDIFRLDELLPETPDLVACVRFAYYFDKEKRVRLLQALSRASRRYVLVQYKTNETYKGRRNLDTKLRRAKRKLHLQQHFVSPGEIEHELHLANLSPVKIQNVGMFSDRVFVLAERQTSLSPA